MKKIIINLQAEIQKINFKKSKKKLLDFEKQQKEKIIKFKQMKLIVKLSQQNK